MRQITQTEAPALAQLIRATGLDHNPDPERIARVSLESNHVTLIETASDESLIGFVDAFSTISQEGILRWEVDLLGVHPAYRGQGIAQSLIREVVRRGQVFGATTSRALVHVENAASASAFQRCGFTLNSAIRQLFVSDDQPATGSSSLPPETYLLPVTTLTYSGVWVEGVVSPQALRCAQAVRARYHWMIAGALSVDSHMARGTGYHMVGSYRWLNQSL